MANNPYLDLLRLLAEKIESLDDLIALKREAGRPKDLEDIAFLESVRKTGA